MFLGYNKIQGWCESMEPDFFQNSKKSKSIRIEEIDEIKVVLVNGQQYMSWELGDEESQRFAVVQLYRCGLGNQEKLAGLFGLHVNTVQKYVADFTRAGLQGLVPQRSGPKDKWKITPEIKAQILFIALKEGILGYDAIKNRLAKRDEHVSIPSIRQVLLENGIIMDMSVLDSKVQQKEFFDFPYKDQIYLDFGIDRELAETISEKGVEGKEEMLKNVEELGSTSEDIKRDRSFFSQAHRIYLDQLEQGGDNAYAGGLLFVPLLEKYSFLSPLRRIINIPTYEGYSLEELCLTLFYLDSFGFRSMEDFKRVYPEEFGTLIGRAFSPSRFTLRRFLHKVRKLKKSEELIDEFAYEYL
ncbi:MAG TPA: helix-turn-helix domain-containing protein, partial [Candidatus Aminicenantes bacterium]|nr:helix-turn-helix domain-containing protein [Candidatus Aminicenantes bacterium]